MKLNDNSKISEKTTRKMKMRVMKTAKKRKVLQIDD